MNTKIDISVVVPIYNAEKFLKSLLDSLSNQNFTGTYEVLLIDDGSTDNSLKICKEYSKMNTLFKTFHYKNAGVSVARNRGIEKAQGIYLSFIDPDDYVSTYFLKNMLNNMKQSQLVECQHVINKQKLNLSGKRKYHVDSKQFSRLILNNDYPEFNGYVNNKLFISKIIKDYKIKFPPNIIVWEDMLFVIEYLHHCKTITIIGDNLYFYRQRKNSVTHDKNKLRKSLKSKIYVSKQVLKKSNFSYSLYKDFGYWYLRYSLAYLKHKVLDKQF
ncbi:glycosyltransferase [Limosilactobacillus reuteri]|uniref:glycosyltransferase n=1 Tax=Limosilactobacillus reuteri TaxID=1598 RepID=UPI001C5BF3FA|nr:glycosyltransferase [Limosilactobacillus reuteri]MBW3349728.1 glycosyltransferase [Limosilactobacillus reuteri]MCC4326405.1 glycosyltransferase [Limosilactobacillus reuteri]MCC4330437.1 glycosyltransferase [Limosilactobacillus reuteri]UUW67583.1 glycosyltransferase [Limosilactobacillus reuteri]